MPVRRSSARFRRARSAVGLDWPGRGEGLSDRESEILALIAQGKSNAEVAALTYEPEHRKVLHPPLGGPQVASRRPPLRTRVVVACDVSACGRAVRSTAGQAHDVLQELTKA